MKEHKVTMTLEVTITTENDNLTKEEIERAAYWTVHPAMESLVNSPINGNTLTDFNLSVDKDKTEFNI
jgi:hypothetical protein